MKDFIQCTQHTQQAGAASQRELVPISPPALQVSGHHLWAEMDWALWGKLYPQGKKQLREREAAHESPSHASHTLSPTSWMEINKALWGQDDTCWRAVPGNRLQAQQLQNKQTNKQINMIKEKKKKTSEIISSFPYLTQQGSLTAIDKQALASDILLCTLPGIRWGLIAPVWSPE